MSNILETLKSEHRLIEDVLEALQCYVLSTDQCEQTVTCEIIKDFATFFHEFIDHCHHGKEENMLFSTISEHGVASSGGGPIHCMLEEHEQGREHIQALLNLGNGTGLLDEKSIPAFIHHAWSYIQLMREHIYKEDQILYPMAAQMLAPEKMDTLSAAANQFNQKTIGQTKLAGFNNLAQELIAQSKQLPSAQLASE
jgi:hemerythrin-like domain-containing protein